MNLSNYLRKSLIEKAVSILLKKNNSKDDCSVIFTMAIDKETVIASWNDCKPGFPRGYGTTIASATIDLFLKYPSRANLHLVNT
jgi:hypothetical protein